MAADTYVHTTRRGFYRRMITILGGAIGALMAAPAAAYLLLRPKSLTSDDLVEVADLAELPTGQPQEVVYFRTRVDGWRRSREKATAWVVKTEANQAVAFSPQCPHLGCIYHWEDERMDASGQANAAFVCPCHASSFAPDGTVLGGPAPRPLDRYVSRVESGKLLLGSQIIKKA